MQTRTPFALFTMVALLAVAGNARAQGTDTVKTRPDSTKKVVPDTGKASLYTEEQATRGEKVYTGVCAECHEKAEYSSADFRVKWNTRPVFDLYDLLRKTMPDGDPGKLPAQDYIDVVGYIMKLNGVAAGKVELPTVDSVLKVVKIDIPVPAGKMTGSLLVKTEGKGRK